MRKADVFIFVFLRGGWSVVMGYCGNWDHTRIQLNRCGVTPPDYVFIRFIVVLQLLIMEMSNVKMQ